MTILFNLLDFDNFYFLIGLILAFIIFCLTARFINLKWYQGFIVGFLTIVIGLIGAKIHYILENIPTFIEYGFYWKGFLLYGAVLFVILAIYINHLIFKRSFFEMGSYTTIPFLVALGFYRFDCLRIGCCGGITVNGYVMPTQLTEIIYYFLTAAIFTYITYFKKMKNGEAFVWFLVTYGFFRFANEFLRERTMVFHIFSYAHFWSILCVFIGVAFAIVQLRKYHGEKQK